MNRKQLRHIFLAFANMLFTLPGPAHSQSACLSVTPPAQQVVYEQPVSINTDVLFNTTFYPLTEAAVTVTNAPTRYSGITTLQRTSISSMDSMVGIEASSQRVAYSTAPSPFPTQVQDTFFLVAMRPSQNQKRQSGSYYASTDGIITNDCTTAPIYTAKNGVLTATIERVVYTYSTPPGVGFAPLYPARCHGRS
jgi:hypothetical protein